MKLPNPFRSRSSWRRLVESAMRHAEQLGDRQIGAEHLLLAALERPEGPASRAFVRAGADPTAAEAAIRWVHADALRKVGLAPVPDAALDAASGAARRFPDFGESGRQIIGEAATRSRGTSLDAVELHLIDAIGDLREGTAARALRELGLRPGSLHAAVMDELELVERAA